MKAKDLLLVGAGVVVGYLLVGYISKSKNKTQSTSSSTESVNEVVDQAKLNKCNEEVALLLQTAKFASKEAQDAFVKKALEDCMAKTV